MTFTGTVSDFDRAGRFGLIEADDGELLLFNLQGTPAALRTRFEIGVRVRFAERESEPTARAFGVTPIDERNRRGPASAPAQRPQG